MKDQTIIITGGSNGIGKAAALKFAEKGTQVLITGRRASSLEAVAARHENIIPLVADSGDPASAELIIEKDMSDLNDCFEPPFALARRLYEIL